MVKMIMLMIVVITIAMMMVMIVTGIIIKTMMELILKIKKSLNKNNRKSYLT